MSASRLLAPSALYRRAPSLLPPQLLRSFSPTLRRALATPANSLIRPTQTTTLGNGLSVATEYSPYLQTATVGIWIDAGSRAETDATSGTAHFLEHLAFKVRRKKWENVDSREQRLAIKLNWNLKLKTWEPI